jgi:outer membrane protein assembly complex protein YaeT
VSSINRAVPLRARFRILLAALLLLAPPSAAWAQDGLVIRQLAFRGNRAIDDLTLANSIETTNSSAFATLPVLRALGMGTKRLLRERTLERDVERLRLLYRIHGFLEVQVDTVIRRDEASAYLTFLITEGRPVLLSRFEITGLDSVPQRQTLLQDLPLRVGDPFNRYRLQDAADTLASRLRDRGYPGAQVFRGALAVDSAAYRATVSLAVQPGPAMVVGPIRVEGGDPGDSASVQDFLTTRPGRVYRQSDLFRSQRNLALADLYRFVSVEVDSAAFDSTSASVPLVVRVVPGPRQRIATSLGYGTYDCLRGSIGWTGRNALGRGRILDLAARFSKLGVGTPTEWGLERSPLCGRLDQDSIGSKAVNYSASVSLRRPGFLSPSNSMVLSVFAELGSEFGVYAREEVGASVLLTRETASRIPVTLGYRLAYGETRADDADFCAYFNVCDQNDVRVLRDRQRRGTLTLAVSSLRVNNLLDPTRGASVGMQVAYSGAVTGSEPLQRFVRVSGDAAVYQTLGRGAVLAGRVRAGMLFAPTVTLDGAGSSRAPYAPPDQRFYAGGPNDVRGYDGYQLGPVVYVFFDTAAVPDLDRLPTSGVTVSPIGGNRVLVGNLELRVPSPILPTRAQVAAFLDVGSVWQDSEELSVPIRVRATPGLGVRFTTPLGPARLDVAYNPYGLPPGEFYRFAPDGRLIQRVSGFDVDEGRRLTVHFAVGQPF